MHAVNLERARIGPVEAFDVDDILGCGQRVKRIFRVLP